MNISSLGEFELIARLTADLTSQAGIALGIGDDCAVLDLGNDQQLLATCDSQVEGIHFTLHISTPEQIGYAAGHRIVAASMFCAAASRGPRRWLGYVKRLVCDAKFT